MKNLVFPVYEFRPLYEGKLLRYNNGNWIDDDGEYDLSFITVDDVYAFGVHMPYRKNLRWSWAKDGNWTEWVDKHPNGNAWHYMMNKEGADIVESWERKKHPNEVAYESAIRKLSSMKGCANGCGVDFYIGDKHILAGLVREKETKKVVEFPKEFICRYCGLLHTNTDKRLTELENQSI